MRGPGEDCGGDLLKVRDLHITFQQHRSSTYAVRGVSFGVAPGRTLGIVGESGSGKSVTARSIMGLYAGGTAIVRGSILLDGAEVVGMRERELRAVRRRTVSMVFQDPMRSLNPVMPIGAQLLESLRLRGDTKGRSALQRRAFELLEMVQMPAPRERLEAYPHQLSGGMRQRVVVAMALASQPKLLIADEPTTALDVTVQAQILDLLDTLRRELSMALILITHDLSIAAERADDIAVMYAGQIVEADSTAALTSDMKMPYTQALFNSTPGPHTPRHSMLPAIAGRPPLLSAPPRSCPFAPRCQRRAELNAESQARCENAEPDEAVIDGRRLRCWFPLGRELVDVAAPGAVAAVGDGRTS